MKAELIPDLPPKPPFWRRACAFLLDFVVAYLVTVIISPNWFIHTFFFLVAWLGNRILFVGRNRGQSIGRWAFDMKLIDRNRRIPYLDMLLRREAITAAEGVLLLWAVYALFAGNSVAFLLVIPPIADAIAAWSDEANQQSFHDRYADTFMASSRRGYSLDVKIQKWVELALRSMRK
jgi:uncharacterized RDD family membrane protein YckC